jgi:hypothetical protein
MRRPSLLCTGIILASIAAPGCGGEATPSSAGYRSSPPPGWLVLSREESKANPDLFAGAVDKLQIASDELVSQFMEEIRAGKVEMLFAPTAAEGFRNNINLRKQVGANPKDAPDLKKACDELPQQLRQIAGRTMRVHRCEFRQFPTGQAMCVEMEGFAPRTRSVTCSLQRSPSVMLQVTGTFTESSLNEMRPLFETFVASIAFAEP